MSQMKTIDMNGHRYTFINTFNKSRNGFKHHSELFEDDQFISEYTAQYLNRTWEAYDYQTSMIGACNAHLSLIENRIDTSIKDALGVKRWCPRCDVYRQQLLEDGTDDMVVELNAYKNVRYMLKTRIM